MFILYTSFYPLSTLFIIFLCFCIIFLCFVSFLPFFTLIYPCVRKQSVDTLVFALSCPLSCVLSTSPSIYAPKYQTSVERLKLPLELIGRKNKKQLGENPSRFKKIYLPALPMLLISLVFYV